MADLVIGCLSQKGGVGKSSIARLIAGTYAAAGWTVKIADFNTTQLTCVHWAEDRRLAGITPEILAVPYERPTNLRREDVNLVIADGRPESHSSSLAIALAADLVVLPAGQSADDLRPQLAFAKELVAKGVAKEKIIFVLTRVSNNKGATVAARSFLAEFEVAEHHIQYMHSYQKSQNNGYALCEVSGFNTASLAEAAQLVASDIIAKIHNISEAA